MNYKLDDFSEVEVASEGSFEEKNIFSRSRKLEKKWTREEDFMMIKMIEERESIWNWKLEVYKDFEKKIKDWKEVAAETNHSVADAKSHWNTIRSRFNSERRKELMSKNRFGVQTRESTYNLYNALKFILKAGPYPLKARRITKDSSIIRAENFDIKDSRSLSPECFNYILCNANAPSNPDKQKRVAHNNSQQPVMSEICNTQGIPAKDRWKKVFSEFVFYELDRYDENDAQTLRNQLMMVCMNFQPLGSMDSAMEPPSCMFNETRIKEEVCD